MAGRRFFIEQGNFEFPDDFACAIVLAHLAIGLVGDEVSTCGRPAHQAGVAVFAGTITDEFDFVMQLSFAVDFNNPAYARFGDHGQSVFKALAGVYLQRYTCVSVGGGGVIFPDDFTFWA